MKDNSFLFWPKKSLGQNFLVDMYVRDKIIDACELNKDDVVLEIGPGKGVLTEQIALRASKLIAIEKDEYLVEKLKKSISRGNVSIIACDILKYPFNSLPEGIKLIGNLPYNIATPIIEKALLYRNKFVSLYITVQLEYGKRLSAPVGSKDYGALTCFVQYYADVKILFKIKNTAFKPVPKVYSCFVQLDLLKEPRVKVKDESLLFRVIRHGFAQRRKSIYNSLSSILGKRRGKDILEELGFSHRLRAEDLSISDYARIVNVL